MFLFYVCAAIRFLSPGAQACIDNACLLCLPRLSANCSRQVWFWIPFFRPYALNYTDRHLYSPVLLNIIVCIYISIDTNAIQVIPTQFQYCPYFLRIDYFCFLYLCFLFVSLKRHHTSSLVYHKYTNTWNSSVALMTLCYWGAFANWACLRSLVL